VIKAWLERGLQSLPGPPEASASEIPSEDAGALEEACASSSSATALDLKLQQTLPALFRLPLTPNQFTLAGTAMSLMAALALAQGWFALAALGLALGALGDVMDGAVARIRGVETLFGAFLDSTLDRLADMALFLGLMIYYAGQGRLGAVWLTGGALVASVLVSYARARAESLMPSFRGGWMGRGERMLLLELGTVAQVLFPTGFAMVLILWTILLGSGVTVVQRIEIARRGLEDSDNVGRNSAELQ
jgi:CDP-diacylglycerol--glycerol-3-phosphate 3-phosphatidyltransferase